MGARVSPSLPPPQLTPRRGKLTPPERYSTRTIWLSTLLNIAHSEVLVGIAQPLFWATVSATVTATTALFFARLLPFGQASKSLGQMHSLLGGALSLLLVFRTNSAYNRFWEARRIWESIVNRCRDLARFAHAYKHEISPVRVTRLANLMCAYPVALRRHLVGASRYHPALQPDPLPPLSPAMVRALRGSSNRPLFLCKRMTAELRAVPESGLLFSSRERLLALSLVNQLSSYIGACERLLQTPVPLNYARHTSRFLTLWCFTLPLSLVGSMGFGVVPVTAFVTWCLFGIQEIGLFIEHCALDDGDVFMDTIADQVMLDVVEAIRDEDESDDALWPTAPPVVISLPVAIGHSAADLTERAAGTPDKPAAAAAAKVAATATAATAAAMAATAAAATSAAATVATVATAAVVQTEAAATAAAAEAA